MKKISFYLLLTVFVSGCASTTFIPSAQQIPTHDKVIDVYFENQLIGKEYQVLGYANTSGWIFTSEKKLLSSMLKKAHKLDADAIIFVKYSYIPHILIGIPYCEGVLIKYK